MPIRVRSAQSELRVNGMIESTQQMIYAAIVFALVLPEAGRFLQHHAEYERRAGAYGYADAELALTACH